jgi:AAA domain
MLKIRAIKLEVNTTSGAYGAEFNFADGLNIIRADNTSGKSTLFQAILYGLGMEELLDGQNEKTMQAVLKDVVEYPEKIYHSVLSSFVYLEFSNHTIVTTKRSVKNDGRNAKLIEVYKGSMIVEGVKNLIPQSMYIHDKGAATNTTYGFHLYLEKFLGWDLPDVQTTNGDLRKLYIQSLFPAFVIEQKVGWSDFLATIPYFALKNVKSRAIEFLLGLHVFELEQKRQDLLSRKMSIIDKWKNNYSQLLNLTNKAGVNVNNLSQLPELGSKLTPIVFYMIKGDRNISLFDFYEEELLELERMENQNIVFNATKNIEQIQNQLLKTEDRLKNVYVAFDMVSLQLDTDKRKIKVYEEQLKEVAEDLEKNKGARKIYELGSQVPVKLADNLCPTCFQDLKDTLLPQDIEQTPMRIDENINYLEAQKKMIEAYLRAHKISIDEKTRLYNNYNQLMNQELRPQIRVLKQQLVADSKTLSEIEIEKKIKQRIQVKFYKDTISQLDEKLSLFIELTKEWEEVLSLGKKLPLDTFTDEDKDKIGEFEKSFKNLITNFGYRSKPTQNVKISLDNYLPEIAGDRMRYNIRFDSSASDLIRTIWAYTCSLLKVSDKFSNTNHLKFLAFDEPAQHNIANADFRSFLKELSTYKNAQILVFASFNESDKVYSDTTTGIPFTLHWIKDRLIKPL